MSNVIENRRTFLQLLVRLLFVVIPTIAVSLFTLRLLNKFYTAFDTHPMQQAIWLSAGMAVAYGLYFFRARISVTVLLLLIVYWIIDRIIGNIPGEFDMFAVVSDFRLYSTLFIFGWLCGCLLAYWRYASIPIAAFLTVIVLISIVDEAVYLPKTGVTEYFLLNLGPVVAYFLYMMFFAPSLADVLDLSMKKSTKRFVGIGLFFALIYFGLMFLPWDWFDFKPKWSEIEEIRNNREGRDGEGGQKYDQRKGLLERGNRGQKQGQGKPDQGQGGNQQKDDGEDGYKLKDTMQMSDEMSQADYIMFCSKLNNYFPDGTPKPLYFVYHYLTKYDPVKESFIRDPAMPYLDELNVDPSELSMYRSKTDSSVIRNSLASKKRKVVEAEVYVSSNTWKHALLAPASAYYCQTIPVDSSYKKMFRSAYRVKSYTSELNNAYFVYNPSANPQLESFQQERYDELRTVKDYHQTDSVLLSYYTQMPTGPLYDSIRALAQRISLNAKTPVDKVIAVRDYFLKTDENGNRIFRYTLTPGAPSDPNIPNASMLRNFLFRTHAGYCTYYAGASLFLLRSLGIPSRFTTGFATIDRSDKNKGWYWFYASQAHAWTQVYFPGYGWLDFDMTIGNEDQRDAPRPDGTPPLPPPEPWLVVEGKAETAPDKQSKQLDVSFNKIIFFNDDYRLDKTFTRTINASVCRVLYGKKDTTLSAIQPGDSLIVVSYDDAAKQIPQPKSGVKIEDQVEGFPKPIVADEIHIKPRKADEEKQPEKKPAKKGSTQETSWKKILLIAGIVTGGLIVLLLLSPALWLLWLILRAGSARDPKTKADRVYRLALYHFHMAGMERSGETPLEYAVKKADPAFGAGFAPFMNVYLRLKYANMAVQPGDSEMINKFDRAIRPAVRNKVGFFRMMGNYFNIARANRFFRRPENETEEQQPSL